MRTATFRDRSFWRITIGLTIVMEIVTIATRVIYGHSAAEYIATSKPPLLMQIHHMFWAVPFLLTGLVANGRRTSAVMWSLSQGLIVSDLMHHFLVLPLWVGNTGWHWP